VQELDFRKLEELRYVTFTRHVLAIEVDDMFLRRSESEYRGDREKSAPQLRADVRANRRQLETSLKTINDYVAQNFYRTCGTSFGLARSVLDSTFLSTANDRATADFYARSSMRTAEQNNLPPPNTNSHDEFPAHKRRLNSLLLNVRQTLSNIDNQMTIVRSYERTNKSLLVEIHKKYSIPVACLVFVIIGAPLGFMARRGGLATGGGLSLGFFLLYWAFLIGGEDLADRQFISPFVAMWSANFIVGAFGLYLLWRAAKENVTLNFSKLLWWRKNK
jgi:lipopolysaccharide export system permease protein